MIFLWIVFPLVDVWVPYLYGFLLFFQFLLLFKLWNIKRYIYFCFGFLNYVSFCGKNGCFFCFTPSLLGVFVPIILFKKLKKFDHRFLVYWISLLFGFWYYFCFVLLICYSLSSCVIWVFRHFYYEILCIGFLIFVEVLIYPYLVSLIQPPLLRIFCILLYNICKDWNPAAPLVLLSLIFVVPLFVFILASFLWDFFSAFQLYETYHDKIIWRSVIYYCYYHYGYYCYYYLLFQGFISSLFFLLCLFELYLTSSTRK